MSERTRGFESHSPRHCLMLIISNPTPYHSTRHPGAATTSSSGVTASGNFEPLLNKKWNFKFAEGPQLLVDSASDLTFI
jgi:hypothetical protein